MRADSCIKSHRNLRLKMDQNRAQQRKTIIIKTFLVNFVPKISEIWDIGKFFQFRPAPGDFLRNDPFSWKIEPKLHFLTNHPVLCTKIRKKVSSDRR